VKPGGAALRPLSPCPRCGKVPTLHYGQLPGDFEGVCGICFCCECRDPFAARVYPGADMAAIDWEEWRMSHGT